MGRVRITLACALLVLPACQSPSGIALTQRLSDSISRLSRSTQQVLSSESRRMQAFPGRTFAFPFEPGRRGGALTRSGLDGVNAFFARAQLSVQRTSTAVTNQLTGAGRDIKRLADPDHAAYRGLSPRALLADAQVSLQQAWQLIDRGRFLFPGPGDPDRTADPAITTRQETWIERLLRRF